jgi:hypothetical protein
LAIDIGRFCAIILGVFSTVVLGIVEIDIFGEFSGVFFFIQWHWYWAICTVAFFFLHTVAVLFWGLWAFS